jgi:hypothetical protein
MATDTRQPKQHLTMADLCEAIADEKISYTRQDGEYRLTALDLRRMERAGDESDVPLELLAEFGNDALGDAPIQ